MSASIRPRRSMLYVPGDKPRALEKARGLPADGLILDLEDAVAPERKAAARDAIAAAVATGYGGREVLLRIGGAGVAEDWELAGRLAIDGVLLPKVETAEEVQAAASRSRHPIWCMIETPKGVLAAAAIAAASERLAGFVVGTNDLAKELRARHVADRAPLLPSLALVLLAARAHGLTAIDGVHVALDDQAGFEATCRQGMEMGFDGRSLVHPDTIAVANRIYGPSPDELAQAGRLVAAWEAARAEGLGVARIDGRLVEQLHVDEAARLVALGAAIARLEDQPAPSPSASG